MNESASLDKAGWRTSMRLRRRGVTLAERKAAGDDAAALLRDWELRPPHGSRVATFLALAEELPTAPVNKDLHAAGYKLVVPVWSAQERRYRFAEWQPGIRLIAGPMRVPQPIEPCWVSTEQIALFLVPGLAFDRSGGRIGYGAGHYDCMLAERKPSALCVAYGYAWQLVAALPQTASDIRMDWVLTPSFIVKVGQTDRAP